MPSAPRQGPLRAAQRAVVTLWTEQDLEARLCRVLDLAFMVLDRFGVQGFHDSDRPVYSFGPEKAVAETAMLIYATSAVAARPIQERLAELVRRLVPLARSERAAAAIALQPALATKFALPHILLSWMGHCDAGFDDFVQASFRAAVRDGHDRTSVAHAERAWLCSRWGVQAVRSSRKGKVSHSSFGKSLDVFHGSREDAYALTHLVFYETDFGHDAHALGDRTAGVLAVADALLARYLDAEDYDLAGEILLSWPMTATAWSPAAAFAFRVLMRVEREAGVLPCSNLDPQRLAQLDGEAQYLYALGMSYHTAYVMGFLCAAALRSGMATAAIGVPGAPAVLASARESIDDSRGHWQASFATLTRQDQLALTPLLLAIALVQQCRNRDYDAVFALLRVARAESMAPDVACQQAWELLDRMDRCSALVRAIKPARACGH